MAESSERHTDPGGPPEAETLESWLGKKAYLLWSELAGLIDKSYPGVLAPEWLFGGKTHGWSLQYRKGKSMTYHDGKWLAMTLRDKQSLRDAIMMLGLKRRPKNA